MANYIVQSPRQNKNIILQFQKPEGFPLTDALTGLYNNSIWKIDINALHEQSFFFQI